MFLIHILEMILLLIVPVGVVGMLAAIIALSLESNCLDTDTEYAIELEIKKYLFEICWVTFYLHQLHFLLLFLRLG